MNCPDGMLADLDKLIPITTDSSWK